MLVILAVQGGGISYAGFQGTMGVQTARDIPGANIMEPDGMVLFFPVDT